ncbi:hypothetical protein J6590_034409 [Homalodisca vitripennis]|nr:hypothetical protein J6590_034409 [Homalodisca vitripennis]
MIQSFTPKVLISRRVEDSAGTTDPLHSPPTFLALLACDSQGRSSLHHSCRKSRRYHGGCNFTPLVMVREQVYNGCRNKNDVGRE